jgi:methylenetetrahydrofolate reductase (NADPH)
MRDAGELPTGRKFTGGADFFLGSADNPVDPQPGWKPTGLEGKAAAGAQFVQTQFCMDAGVARRYLARLAEHGIANNLFFLIGVVPLRSAKSARWIKEKLFGAVIPDAIIDRMERASDPLAEGRSICIDVVRELAEIPHVAGVHIMAPGNDASVPDVIKAARESVKRPAAV